MTMAANWPMLAALHLLLHSDRLFIGPENQRLPAILEASRRYQNEVPIRLHVNMGKLMNASGRSRRRDSSRTRR